MKPKSIKFLHYQHVLTLGKIFVQRMLNGDFLCPAIISFYVLIGYCVAKIQMNSLLVVEMCEKDRFPRLIISINWYLNKSSIVKTRCVIVMEPYIKVNTRYRFLFSDQLHE